MDHPIARFFPLKLGESELSLMAIEENAPGARAMLRHVLTLDGKIVDVKEQQLYVGPMFREFPERYVECAAENYARLGWGAGIADIVAWYPPFQPVVCPSDAASVRAALQNEAHADPHFGSSARCSHMMRWPTEARAVYFVGKYLEHVARASRIEPFFAKEEFDAICGALEGLSLIGAHESEATYRETLDLLGDDALHEAPDEWLAQARRPSTRSLDVLNTDAAGGLPVVRSLLDTFIKANLGVLRAR
ncbi:MAG: hypothetical protein AAGE52_06325 [Myxococcota bacterium]